MSYSIQNDSSISVDVTWRTLYPGVLVYHILAKFFDSAFDKYEQLVCESPVDEKYTS